MFFCSEGMKRKLPSTPYADMADFIHCRRRYYHKVIEGLQLKPRHFPEAVKLAKAWYAHRRNVFDEDFDPVPVIQPLELNPEQMAKLSALRRAETDLEIKRNTQGLLGCRYKIHTSIGRDIVVAEVDRAYEDFIVITKLTSRPDFYQQRENLAYELGTCFLGNEGWDYGVVEITRVPTLKSGQGKFDGEDPKEYEERLYGDIISRPAYYFVGWDRKTRTFGVRFWRSEFDLEEIKNTYFEVLHDIQQALVRDAWYPNNLACHVPGPCQYLPKKRTGVISDEIFERKKKGGDASE